MAEAGPADGPLVILLHGFPEYWAGWKGQIGPLAESGFRVVAPDQRGYNLSDKPRRASHYNLDLLAGDIANLIAEQGRERACVVGHDWGGVVAWWLGLRHADKLEKLAILNVPHPDVMRKTLRTSKKQRRKSRYMFYFQLPWLPERLFRQNDFERGIKGLMTTSRPEKFDEATLAGYREAWSQPGAPRGMLNWYRAAARHPPKSRGPRTVSVPTLLLWGERDRFLGKEMIDPSAALLEEGRVLRFPEATHWLQHEEPEAVNQHLIDHFRE